MVLADGSVLETGGRDGCYESGTFDLPGLICASEGTFGIITSLWVRLVPKATSFRTIVGFFPDTAGACEAVSDVIASLEMDDATRADMEQWTGCVAGALTEEEFEATLRGAGFEDVEIRRTHGVHEHASAAIVRARKPAT